MKKRLLIFDLDGTIADTIYSIRDGLNMALDKYGFPKRNYEQTRAAIGNGARELIRLSLPKDKRSDASLIDQVLADYDRFYEQTYANLDGTYDGVDTAIRTLTERGYKVAVLSNKQDAYVKKIVPLLFPNGEISYAMGQTDLPKKPDPTVPLMIATEFGAIAEECAFIGDSDVDVLTARNSGMYSVAVTWGYRPRSELLEADALVDNADELLSLFE